MVLFIAFPPSIKNYRFDYSTANIPVQAVPRETAKGSARRHERKK
jgi:hypothetical protein